MGGRGKKAWWGRRRSEEGRGEEGAVGGRRGGREEGAVGGRGRGQGRLEAKA